MKFGKAPTSFDQQVDRLMDRGMVIPDRNTVIRYLSHLNYYRLTAYWLPFEADHETHRFFPETRFSDVLDLYIFDRELRLLILDAIERVEVSVRTGFSYHSSQRHGSHPHLKPELFFDKGKYRENLAKLKDEVNRSQRSGEKFVRHFREKYDEPLPPIWAAVELMSFGQLSKWYGNLKSRTDRKAIAEPYGLDEKCLRSFLHHLSVIRNLCAHHSRLWNRELTVIFRLPGRPAELASGLNPNPEGKRRLYNTLVMLVYLMDIVSPGHHWDHRLASLFDRHGIDFDRMGFPKVSSEYSIRLSTYGRTC
uniref:Abortive infection bacteriophage resistance protein n=1 Tax=Candidatus Kentrum sp. LPFa TaxID=2126335 RepID=A0A450W2K4_9GAMM|nr:MAG: Abortive infection bacteriophage resistance protein [Candidatus Kentron sp. LPFa]